ncbi:MAG: SAM-dependent methyltransferase [Chthoniobacterales bacterium]
MKSPPSLEALLKEEIQEKGAISFSRFMERALYEPDIGYYSSRRALIGKAGDFYTNVSVGAIFGKIICEQLLEIWSAMNSPARFTIVEQGAFDGQLAEDILSHAHEYNASFFAALTYRITEPFPRLQKAQSERLSAFSKKMEWIADLAESPEIEGAFLCNELVDAMPVELVEWDGLTWKERRVVWTGDSFAFALHPVESPALAHRLSKIPQPQEAGYQTEVNLQFEPWIQNLGKKLHSGYALLCDYGYSRSNYYAARRREGTLSCYSNHRRSYDALTEPGSKDITAHVDFTSLAESARAAGLMVAGFSDQHRFLVGAAEKFLNRVENSDITKGIQKDLRGLQTLLHPETMGRAFHYLGLSRGMDITLSGFRHTPQGIQSLDAED